MQGFHLFLCFNNCRDCWLAYLIAPELAVTPPPQTPPSPAAASGRQGGRREGCSLTSPFPLYSLIPPALRWRTRCKVLHNHRHKASSKLMSGEYLGCTRAKHWKVNWQHHRLSTNLGLNWINIIFHTIKPAVWVHISLSGVWKNI